MTEKEVLMYISKNKKVCVADIQMHFSISYIEARNGIRYLEGTKKITKVDALYFEINPFSANVPEVYVNVLKDCIKANCVSFSKIQTKYELTFNEVEKIIKWMANNHFISGGVPKHILIDMDYFNIFFKEFLEHKKGEQDARAKAIEKQRQKLEKQKIRLMEHIKTHNQEKKIDENVLLKCQEELDKTLKEMPNISYEDFEIICILKAASLKPMDDEMEYLYRNFLKIKKIYTKDDFEEYKQMRLALL